MKTCAIKKGLLLAVVLGTVVPAASPFAHAQDKQEPAISAADGRAVRSSASKIARSAIR